MTEGVADWTLYLPVYRASAVTGTVMAEARASVLRRRWRTALAALGGAGPPGCRGKGRAPWQRGRIGGPGPGPPPPGGFAVPT